MSFLPYFLFILAAICGYLLGSINSSIIVGRLYRKDIRMYGSGNAGTTNTLRVLGKKAALLVLIGDLLKGILSYLIGYYITKEPTAGMIAGSASILGHVWPIYFGFRGGKGVLTSFAVMLMMDWKISLMVLGIFIIVVILTRYVSLGSIIAAICLPILAAILSRPVTQIVFSIIIAVLLIFMHRANIKRLASGTESKLGTKKT